MPPASPIRRTIFTPEGLLTPPFLRWFGRQKNAVLLETTRAEQKNDRTYIFLEPTQIIQAHTLDEVGTCLEAVDEALKRGYHAAGYLAYEAGYAFERAVRFETRLPNPLLWFGLYAKPVCIDIVARRVESGLSLLKSVSLSSRRQAPTDLPAFKLSPSATEKDYREAFRTIQSFIAKGDTYQVNHTFKVRFPVKQDAATLYDRLRGSQRVAYSAWINAGDARILSFSPEMFFRMEGSKIFLKPMKGTSPRGRTTEEDRKLRQALLQSEKDKAENLMIVDLLRNDVGRVAKSGSVSVPKFFEIERYQTVFQATSTIKAILRKGVGVPELIRSLFPSGSVTGAPKIRTMQIIRELEREPRGVYTGSIGFFSPEGKARFNVAIRTAVLDRKHKQGEMGIGSGITADSTMEGEYEECLLKAKFLNGSPREFRLFETLKWTKSHEWFLLPLHLRRLQDSASYFDFKFERSAILSEMKKLERELRRAAKRKEAMRVKLLLGRSGKVEFEYAPLSDLPALPRIGIAEGRTDSRDVSYFHKTTLRPLYDAELSKGVKRGLFDVLFLNERGELTEGARSNVILRRGNQYATPPISCGVLKGTYRTFLMNNKTFLLAERILKLDDLLRADDVFLCNALRGMVKVEIHPMSQ
ncbi:MAG: aminodeoxychorismate synthase component I [Bacteroidota bacterium]